MFPERGVVARSLLPLPVVVIGHQQHKVHVPEAGGQEFEHFNVLILHMHSTVPSPNILDTQLAYLLSLTNSFQSKNFRQLN
jgi:hypothetical protein